MFKLFKKKKESAEEVDLPPPPMPPERQMPEPSELEPELPEIKPVLPEIEEEAPSFPKIPEHVEIPRVPEHPTMEPPELDIPEIQPRKEFAPRPVFDKTIKETVTREEVLRPKEVKPMFVAVDEYTTLATNTNFVRSKLVEAEEYLQRLTDLKNQELKAFSKWRKTLEQVESKLSYVDKVIAEAQG